MNFEIKTLNSVEELPEIAEMLNRSLPFDSITTRLLKEKTFDDKDFNPETALIAEAEGRPIGFFLGVKRGETGFLKLFGVEPKWQMRGVGSALLQRIETRLKQLGCKKIRILEGAPNYFQPGLDPRYTAAYSFLVKRGYRVFDETANMIAELEGIELDFSAEARLSAKFDVHLKVAEKGDLDATLQFVRQTFPAWTDEVLEAFKADPPTIHIAVHNGEVIGFSAYETNNKGTGWFGPMGVSTNWRGHGIGRLLLLRCLISMREMGFRKAIIAWVGPIRFYFKTVGAVVNRIFWRMEKEL